MKQKKTKYIVNPDRTELNKTVNHYIISRLPDSMILGVMSINWFDKIYYIEDAKTCTETIPNRSSGWPWQHAVTPQDSGGDLFNRIL